MWRQEAQQTPIAESTLARASRSRCVSISKRTGKVALCVGRSVLVCADAVSCHSGILLCADVGGIAREAVWSEAGDVVAVATHDAVVFASKQASCRFPVLSKGKRVSVEWHPFHSVAAVWSPEVLKLLRVSEDGSEVSENGILELSGIQKCVWSCDGSRLLCFRKGVVSILQYSDGVISMPQTELTLPLSQTMRAAMCVRESSDSGGSDIVMATFDMPEDFLFSDFDISGLRGWQSPPSALILPSSASKPDVTLLPRAAESSQSLNPFSLNLEIPDTKLTQKTASSVLISMRVSASHVTELSRTHLPILMPDLLTVNTVCHELLASNHSIGAILSLHYDPTSFEIAPVPHQTLRLEPRHFALGMDMDLDAREARLVVLSATRSKAVKAREGVTGFSPRMETEVDLKVVTYCKVLPLREEGMPDALSCTGKVEGTNLQYFTLLEGSRVTEEDEHDEDSDEERFVLKMPGAAVAPVIQDLSELQALSQASSELVKRSDMHAFMESVNTKLDAFARKQDEMLELLKLLVLRRNKSAE